MPILSFADDIARAVYRKANNIPQKRVNKAIPQTVQQAVRKTLGVLDKAISPNDLMNSSLRYEKVTQFGPEAWSVRINDRFRVVAESWPPQNVRVLDYH